MFAERMTDGYFGECLNSRGRQPIMGRFKNGYLKTQIHTHTDAYTYYNVKVSAYKLAM